MPFLFLGAHHHDRGADHGHTHAVVGPAGGYPGPGELLVEHHPLDGGQPAAAVLLRPGGCHQPVGTQELAPLGNEPGALVLGQAAQALPSRRQVLGQERLDLLPVLLGLG